MQNPAKHDICVYRNADFEESFTFTEEGTGDVVDMTAWTGEASIRSHYTSQSPILCTFTLDFTKANTGCITIKLSHTITANIPPRLIGYYDLLLRDTTGTQQYYIEGLAHLKR